MSADPRTTAEIADALDARAAKEQRDFDHSFAAFGEQPPLQECAAAALLRAASARLRAMDAAIAPFIAATGEYPDGQIWVEPDRVPGHAWADLRAARTARGES